jgi:hypothetical protein
MPVGMYSTRKLHGRYMNKGRTRCRRYPGPPLGRPLFTGRQHGTVGRRRSTGLSYRVLTSEHETARTSAKTSDRSLDLRTSTPQLARWGPRLIIKSQSLVTTFSRLAANRAALQDMDWQPKDDQRFILRINGIRKHGVAAEAGRRYRPSAQPAVAFAPKINDHCRTHRQPGYSGPE